MKGYTRWLFAASIILPLLAVMAFHFAFWFSPLLCLGFLLAGAAGGCVSVMAKIPELDLDRRGERQRVVGLSGESNAYGRRVLSRIGIGVAASLIGCGFLAWGFLSFSIQNQSFTEAVNSCTASPATGCTGGRTLILLCVPMLLGFSERALTSLERAFSVIRTGSQKG